MVAMFPGLWARASAQQLLGLRKLVVERQNPRLIYQDRGVVTVHALQGAHGRLALSRQRAGSCQRRSHAQVIRIGIEHGFEQIRPLPARGRVNRISALLTYSHDPAALAAHRCSG